MPIQRYLEFFLNHYMLALALLVVTYLLLQDLFETLSKKYQTISPLGAVTKMNDGETFVIDVREPQEYAESHIIDAVNTPLSKLPEHLPALEAYKALPLLVACQSGTRASTAARKLAKAGFTQVFVITGGMQAWENDYKLPVKISKKKKS